MTARSLSLPSGGFGAPAVVLLLAAAAAMLAWNNAAPSLAAWGNAPSDYDPARMLLLYSTLPRLVTALICGAALALSGTLFQQVLRNPLASPTTLGVSAGASLALSLAVLFAPALIGVGRDLVALAGSAAATALIFALGARRGFSPFSLVLSGLVVSLWCGAFSSILILLNDRYMVSLFIWGAGSLAQQSWEIPLGLLPRIGLLAVLAVAMARPLALLEIGENSAGALGLSVSQLRLATVAVAVGLAGFVVSAVGVIGFIGLVAPAIARLAGARRVSGQLLWSPLIGAALLWFTDESVKAMAGVVSDFLPTGAVTAVFGSPLLLLLLPRLKAMHRSVPEARKPLPPLITPSSRNLLLVFAIFAVLLATALFFGRTPDGRWTWLGAAEWDAVLPMRAPRVFAALAAGAMLAVAGTILQRLTNNDMASPEVLGVSAGATIGVAISLFVFVSPALGVQIGFAAVGAIVIIAVIFVLGMRSGFAPERVLLAGIALGAMLDAFIGVLAASGDPRALTLIRWMGGSTYSVDATSATTVCILAAFFILIALTTRRWLDLLPLGAVAARELGIPVSSARGLLFLLAAVLSAAATLVVGPLSFVGLMAPHLAREAGLTRALPQLLGAALAGGGLMVLADWGGRMMAFPYQMPAGLVSALVGAPFLIFLLRRRA